MMRSRKINGANAKWYCEVFYTAPRAVRLTAAPGLVRRRLIEVNPLAPVACQTPSRFVACRLATVARQTPNRFAACRLAYLG